MTKQIQGIARQVLEQSISVPRNTGVSDLQGAFGELGKLGTQMATNYALEKASQKGAAEGLLGPKKLAPGVTAATRAYNESFLSMQADMVSTNARTMMLEKASDVTAPGNLNEFSARDFDALSKNIIAGTLEGVNEEIRPQLTAQLTKDAVNIQSKVIDRVEKYNHEKLVEETNKVISDTSNDWLISSRTDDKRQTKELKDKLVGALSDQKNLGLISQVEFDSKLDEIKNQEKISDIVRRYRDSVSSGKEDEFLFDFVTDSRIREDIKAQAGAEIRKEKNLFDSLISGHESSVVQDAKNEIQAGTFNVEKLKDIESNISTTNFLKVKGAWQSSLISQAKQDEGRLNYVNALTSGDSFTKNNTPDNVKNGVYEDYLNVIVAKRSEELGMPDYQATPYDKANAALVFSDSIPAFAADANENLMYGDLETGVAWIEAFNLLNSDDAGNKEALRGLSGPAKEIAYLASFRKKYSEQDPRKILSETRKFILDKSDPEIQAINDRVQTYATGRNSSVVSDAFKSSKGSDPFGRGNDAAWGIYKDAYLRSMKSNGTPEVAKKVAQDETRGWSTSFYGPENEVVNAAIEKEHAYGEDFWWLENQVMLFEQSLPEILDKQRQEIEKQTGSPVVGRPIIKNVGNKKLISESENESDLVFKQFNRSGILPLGDSLTPNISDSKILGYNRRPMEVNGVEKVFRYRFSHLNEETGNKVYTVLYDNGVSLETIPFNNDMGVAQIEILPFNEFAPNVFNELEEKSATQLKERAIDRSIDASMANIEANFFKRQVVNFLIKPQLKKQAKDLTLEEISKLTQISRDYRIEQEGGDDE